MICIVDYGAGNLRSVQKAVEHWGVETIVSSSAKDIDDADKIIFPGVGAFGRAIEAIERLQLRTPLTRAIKDGKPFLGICLGLQLLFESSEESPGVTGLSVLNGSVKRFPSGLKVPHLGWNVLLKTKDSPLWKDIPDNSYYYFAHSYYIQPDDEQVVIGKSDYGINFPVAIQQGNLLGLQFHPEKSQKNGLKILKNFIEMKG